ncbi:hypothetical protein A9Q93_01065 [Nonlabens dokdonensis]|uniref:Polysaccharide pyruvyl transferase domain-containing protein n=1 Tax=Nonlabens dokdonensis TaxID=328515 RepID=A0A1Z8BFR3_9FLAO|nr:polysaccharide pyruvyl transferase family protein [Nonlabens dokdonensis]OUS21423.1 hypothetical protein A9Q93_01065 [Nonlabens dokdonensis]
MVKNIDIAIRGGYGLYNFGDDALIHSLFNYLTKDKGIDPKKVVLLCRNEAYLHKLLIDVNVLNYNYLPKDLKINHLIYGGGTQFYSFDPIKESKIEKFLNHPKRTLKNAFFKARNLFVSNKFLENKFEITTNVNHHHLLGVGLGPFSANDTTIENKTKRLFKSAEFISVRDEFAEGKCKSWGIEHFIKSPDICYGLDVGVQKEHNSSVKNIAIIVRDWNHNIEGKEYYNSIMDAVKDLRTLGYNITYVSYDMYSDLTWLKYFKDQRENILQWDPNNNTIDKFIESHYKFDLVITARFHGAVFTSLIGKPFITIGIEPKLEMISSLYSEGSHCWNMPFEKRNVLKLVKEIDENYSTYVENVHHQTLENKKNAHFQFEALYKQIANK